MGGAVDCPGNVTDAAEFNVWNDPEAAEIALNQPVATTLIGLDVCNQVTFTRDDLRKMGGPAAEMLTAWFNTHEDGDEFQLCDPLAVAVAIDPTLVTTVATAVSVDTSDTTSRGATRRAAAGHQINVALDVDVNRAKALISDRVFQREGSTPGFASVRAPHN
jgi:inosine-uridine nucleoside N-ribohydrolase